MAATVQKSDKIFQDNLNLLREQNPGLAQYLEQLPEAPEFQTEPSREGPPTLYYISGEGKRTSLHSRYNPVEEASRFIRDFPFGTSPNFLVLGFGLGFHVAELIRNSPARLNLLIVESQPHFIRLALGLPQMGFILNNAQLKFITGANAENLKTLFNDWKDSFTLNGFIPVRFGSLTRHAPEFYSKIENRLSEMIKVTQVAHNTRRALSKILVQNLMENLEVVRNARGVSELKNQAKGKAALLVGAGPSLDKNIQLIKGAQDRALVIAVSTAFKPLIKSGIAPDFVVAIDPKEIACSAFENIHIPDSTFLVFDPSIPGAIIDHFPERGIAVDSPLFLWEFLLNFLPGKGRLEASSSVAHTAFHLARHMGCDPVILVGQDLAYTGTRSHCSGAFHNDQNHIHWGPNVTRKEVQQERNIKSSSAMQISMDRFGKTVTTSSALDSFRFSFENNGSKAPGLINATEGGLPLEGFENRTLKEALNSLPIGDPLGRSFTASLKSHRGKDRDIGRLLRNQAEKFADLREELRRWLQSPAPRTKLEIEERVALSEQILERAVQDECGIRLLQEYLYSAFLDWNQRSTQCSLLKTVEERQTGKYERDKALFKQVLEGIGWFQVQFGKIN